MVTVLGPPCNTIDADPVDNKSTNSLFLMVIFEFGTPSILTPNNLVLVISVVPETLEM